MNLRTKFPKRRRSARLRLLRRSLLAARKRLSICSNFSSVFEPPLKQFRLSLECNGISSNFFHFGALPLHIQRSIFLYLPLRCRVNMERVSHLWHRLLSDCWSSLTWADIPASVTEGFNIRPIDDNHVCGFLRKCGHNLRKIDFFFPRFHIGDHVLYSIAQRCGRLRQLRISTDVAGGEMAGLLKTYSNQLASLLSLSISHQAENGPGIHNGLRAVARCMTQLETYCLDVYSMPPFVGALFPNSQQHMHHYSLLLRQPAGPSSADQNRWKWVTPEYVDQFLTYLADVYPLLEELDLSLDTNYRVDEVAALDHLRRIGAERPLQRLNLRLSYLFEDYDVWFGATALQALAHWSRLTDLSLWTCQLPDDFLTLLAESGLGTRLVKLRLSIVRSLSHDYLCGIFERCRNLHTFSLLFSVDDHFYCPRSITADTIEALWQHCRNVVEVELMDCDHVDLAVVVSSMHRYMHSVADPLTCSSSTPSSPDLQLVYKTRLPLRLRSLTRIGHCCMTITRKRDDLLLITLPRYCAANYSFHS